MPRAVAAPLVFASRRMQPALLALLVLTAAQLMGAVASCTPEFTPQMGVATRVALHR